MYSWWCSSQEGLFHEDAEIWAICDPTRVKLAHGEFCDPLVQATAQFEVNSFARQMAIEDCRCRGFMEVPKENANVAFYIPNLSTCGVLPFSTDVRQFVVNKDTKAVEPMQAVKIEQHVNRKMPRGVTLGNRSQSYSKLYDDPLRFSSQKKLQLSASESFP